MQSTMLSGKDFVFSEGNKLDDAAATLLSSGTGFDQETGSFQCSLTTGGMSSVRLFMDEEVSCERRGLNNSEIRARGFWRCTAMQHATTRAWSSEPLNGPKQQI